MATGSLLHSPAGGGTVGERCMGANQRANDKKRRKQFRVEDDIDHGIEQLQPLVHGESWVLAGRLVLHFQA